jgi:alkanesulfonate monooxygenase SsuD/methylene tetrahydromethanopterin reductase-like flavin-dependent oxidoreductase (luciferase family)
MRRRIDIAAEAAGRDPAQIRSILNLNVGIDPGADPQPDVVTGSAKQVVSQLQELITRYGFTGFSFLPSRPDDLQQIAEEVLPLLQPSA